MFGLIMRKKFVQVVCADIFKRSLALHLREVVGFFGLGEAYLRVSFQASTECGGATSCGADNKKIRLHLHFLEFPEAG
jgi:hypothetical protein